jgi:excisionase family DNA binding protein
MHILRYRKFFVKHFLRIRKYILLFWILRLRKYSIISIIRSMKDNYLTTQQAADKLGVTDARIRQLIATGMLPAQRFGPRSHMIREQDLQLVSIKQKGRPRISETRNTTTKEVKRASNTSKKSKAKP